MAILKWSKSDGDSLVAYIGFIFLIIFSFSVLVDSTSESVPSVDHSDLVKLKLSLKAQERGAFCLDGSLPGYHFHKGSRCGSKSWLLFLEAFFIFLTFTRETWHSPTSTRIENETIAKSVGDWFFNRKPVKPCSYTSC